MILNHNQITTTSQSRCIENYSGTCTYKCYHGTWQQQTNSCKQNCSQGTKNNCQLSVSNHGILKNGTCVNGTTGSCKYKCDEGAWQQEENNCSKNCIGRNINQCTLITRQHNRTSGSCKSGYEGDCQYKCNNGNWEQKSYSCRKPNRCKGTVLNGCNLSESDHWVARGYCASGYTGDCTFRCNNGNWTKLYNNCNPASSITSDIHVKSFISYLDNVDFHYFSYNYTYLNNFEKNTYLVLLFQKNQEDIIKALVKKNFDCLEMSNLKDRIEEGLIKNKLLLPTEEPTLTKSYFSGYPNNLNTRSDFPNNLEDLRKLIEKLMKVRPVVFVYKNFDGIPSDRKFHLGVVAQDLEKVFPSMVSMTPRVNFDGRQKQNEDAFIRQVYYGKFSYFLQQAMTYQVKTIKSFERQNSCN